MHNLSYNQKDDFYPENFKNLQDQVITIYRESIESLSDVCDELLLPSELKKDESIEFAKSPYKQTSTFFKWIINHFSDIWNGAVENLGDAGFEKSFPYQG